MKPTLTAAATPEPEDSNGKSSLYKTSTETETPPAEATLQAKRAHFESLQTIEEGYQALFGPRQMIDAGNTIQQEIDKYHQKLAEIAVPDAKNSLYARLKRTIVKRAIKHNWVSPHGIVERQKHRMEQVAQRYDGLTDRFDELHKSTYKDFLKARTMRNIAIRTRKVIDDQIGRISQEVAQYERAEDFTLSETLSPGDLSKKVDAYFAELSAKKDLERDLQRKQTRVNMEIVKQDRAMKEYDKALSKINDMIFETQHQATLGLDKVLTETAPYLEIARGYQGLAELTAQKEALQATFVENVRKLTEANETMRDIIGKAMGKHYDGFTPADDAKGNRTANQQRSGIKDLADQIISESGFEDKAA